MSSFFRFFPTIQYGILVENKPSPPQKVFINATDIFRNVDVDDLAIEDSLEYILYSIVDGDRPDIVSQKLYGTTDYHWTFFVVNNSLKNGLQDWPFSSAQFAKYMDRYFGQYQVLETTKTIQTVTYSFISDDEEPVEFTIDFEETTNTFHGLDLEQDFIRVRSEGNLFAIKYNSDMEQLFLVPEDSLATTFNPASFTFETTGSTQAELDWTAHYIEWARTSRPGYWRQNTVDELSDVVHDMSTGTLHPNGRYAPHSYYDPLGVQISRRTYLSNPTVNNTETGIVGVKTYEDYYNELNDSRSKIRVVHPIHIKDFVKEYRTLLTQDTL